MITCKDNDALLAEIAALKTEIAELRQMVFPPPEHSALPDFASIFDNIPAMVFVIEVTPGTKYRMTMKNRRHREITGTAKDGCGKYIEELLPGEITDQRLAHYEECAKTGSEIEFEEYISPPMDLFFVTRLHPVRDSDGRVRQIIGVTRDITDIKIKEDRHQKERTLQDQLFAKLPEIVMIHDNGIISYVNDVVSLITGHSPSEVIGRSIYDFIPQHEAQRIADIHMRRTQKEKMPDIYETTILHKDKSFISVEIRIIQIDYNGKDARMVVITDISERKKIKNIEDRFKDVAEMLPETIYETDINGTITYVNSTGLSTFGYSIDDIRQNVNLRHLFPPEELDRVIDHRNRTLSNQSSRRVEFSALKKDGSRIPVIFNAVPIIQDGVPVGTRGIIFDITERKKTENELHINKRRLETLFSVSKMNASRIQDLDDFVLSKIISLTKSRCGYLAIIDDKNNRIEFAALQNDDYQSDRSGPHRQLFQIGDSGLWEAALSSRAELIDNDVTSSHMEKNTPAEYNPEQRHLSIPIFLENRIVAIIGVIDKTEPYDDSDLRQLTVLMNEIFRIIQQKSHENEIATEREKLSVTLRSIIDGVITVNRDGVITMFNNAAEKMTLWSAQESIGRKLEDVIYLSSEKTQDESSFAKPERCRPGESS
ncbi:MAG TPA: PAS domain S-box protein, partial [Spirochaetota bacterium]